jgi:hypothetical protein
MHLDVILHELGVLCRQFNPNPRNAQVLMPHRKYLAQASNIN